MKNARRTRSQSLINTIPSAASRACRTGRESGAGLINHRLHRNQQSPRRHRERKVWWMWCPLTGRCVLLLLCSNATLVFYFLYIGFVSTRSTPLVPGSCSHWTDSWFRFFLVWTQGSWTWVKTTPIKSVFIQEHPGTGKQKQNKKKTLLTDFFKKLFLIKITSVLKSDWPSCWTVYKFIHVMMLDIQTELNCTLKFTGNFTLAFICYVA